MQMHDRYDYDMDMDMFSWHLPVSSKTSRGPTELSSLLLNSVRHSAAKPSIELVMSTSKTGII